MDNTPVREAFNRHAATYDQRFASLESARAVRGQVWKIANDALGRATRILDLGCGSGEDSIHFAQRGLQVTSVDIAPAMIARLQAKASSLGVASKIDAVVSDLQSFRCTESGHDGLFSNFGVLNCIEDPEMLRPLAQSCLKPGSPVVLVTMGRFYPFETLRFLLRGDIRRAFRRWSKKATASVEGVSFPVWYHSLRDLRMKLAPDFTLERVKGLRSVECGLASFPPLGSLSDHYISVWRFR